MRSSDDQRQIMSRVISLVRSRRATSRRSLADALRISPTTAGQYVDQLIASGHLHESGLERGAMGRPKRALTTVPQAGWFAGVEFNAERVQAVRLDFSGHLVASQTQPLPAEIDARRVMQVIMAAVTALTPRRQGGLLSIGVGVPGVVDPRRGVGLRYSFIPDWNNVPVANVLARRFHAPVVLENNLRVIALAEKWFGGGRDLDDYAILGPRSGFGIAMVKHGRLIGGAHHAAGEIGLWPWPAAGKGRSRELHDALSAPATWRRLTGHSTRAKLPADLPAALARCAGACGERWNEVIGDFARVLGSVQLLVDAGIYFLHGPLTSLGARFCESVAAEATRRIPTLATSPLRIVPSALGDDAGALGAASMAMEAWMPGG
jgi:predicted NBD/HSP70 family sugar kinase